MWHPFAKKIFLEKLAVAEQAGTSLALPELRFVRDMRAMIKGQLDAADIGINSLLAWEPTVRQVNYLNSIHEHLK